MSAREWQPESTSIVFQPTQLTKAFFGARAWRAADPLAPGDRAAHDLLVGEPV